MADESEESYDPMAYYRQQQQEMLLQATQHVQHAREEIAEAQSQASLAQSTREAQMEQQQQVTLAICDAFTSINSPFLVGRH